MKVNKLTPQERFVIVTKGTEKPWTGEYVGTKSAGTYICKQCDAPLYQSKDKFDSHCGWPSFDDEIKGAVKRIQDADGSRTEIVCANCGGHLGHVFLGEKFTKKDTRHCVNSISLKFVPAEATEDTETTYFAAGCFWGVEYYLKRDTGVISTTVGYAGGTKENPTYKDVCYTNTGHAEVVEVIFDPKKTSFETLARLFFEIHDPTEIDKQGPDVGEQYRSAIYYTSEKQKETAQMLIDLLKAKGYKVATEIKKAGKFWIGEDYHQDYYDNKGGTPYCHAPRKRF